MVIASWESTKPASSADSQIHLPMPRQYPISHLYSSRESSRVKRQHYTTQVEQVEGLLGKCCQGLEASAAWLDRNSSSTLIVEVRSTNENLIGFCYLPQYIEFGAKSINFWP